MGGGGGGGGVNIDVFVLQSAKHDYMYYFNTGSGIILSVVKVNGNTVKPAYVATCIKRSLVLSSHIFRVP